MPGELVGAEDRQRDQERRRGGRLEALGEPLDDVGRVPGDRGAADRLHGAEPGRRVVVGDHEQPGRHRHPDQAAKPQVGDAGGVAQARRLEADVVHQPLGDRIERRRREHGRDREPPVQGRLDVAGPGAHRERPDDRGDDRHRADHQRVDRDLPRLGEGQHAEQHHRHRGDRVGLEQVGRHPGAVADVVADVVGDHRRVARVVLGDPRLDLADQVGADVGGLGEDPAPEPGEDRDQRAAEPEPDQRVDRLLVRLVGEDQDPEVAGDAEQGEADDEQAGHRAALEGDVERRRDASASRLRDARVGAHREVHADEPGRARERAADHEADRGVRRFGGRSAAPRAPPRRRR